MPYCLKICVITSSSLNNSEGEFFWLVGKDTRSSQKDAENKRRNIGNVAIFV